MNPTPAPDGFQGRVLTDLWKSYDAAVKADRPKQMAEILTQIKKEAKEKHYAADFFDAGKEYVEACRIRNWKTVADARNEFARDVKEFGDPVVTFAWMEYAGDGSNASRFRFVEENKTELKSRRSAYFHQGLSYMGGQLNYFMANDYEYALWSLIGRENITWSAPEKNAVYKALKEEVTGRYPAEGYLEHFICNKIPRDTDVKYYTALAEKYKGKAFSLWPRQVLLRRKFDNMNKDSRTTEAAYKALLAEAQAFDQERNRYTGDEQRIASPIYAGKEITKSLQEPGLWLSMQSDTVIVTFRNMNAAEVKIYQVNLTDRKKTQKTVFTKTVDNPGKRFYVKDQGKFKLPKLDDADYQIVVKSGKEEDQLNYSQHTLSLALRKAKDGYGAYATDYLTGAPVKRGDLFLYNGDKVVARVKDFIFDGFTKLPEAFQKQLDKDESYHNLVCSFTGQDGKLRSSGLVEENHWFRYSSNDTRKETRCNIYKDRGAYNPGDLLQFKAVLYEGDFIKEVHVLDGVDLEVRLLDSESKLVESKDLKTNEFGSIAGAFTLPVDRRNGRFTLEVRKKGGKLLESETFTVDEFVLPTYELAFEREEKLFFPGEEVTVKGRLTSYSGHSLSGATLETAVQRYGEVIPATVDKKADGTFTVRFTPKVSGYYRVNVTVMDETGETQEWGTGVYVDESIRINMYLENAADGQFDITDEKALDEGMGLERRVYASSRKILTEDKAAVNFTVRNSNGDRVPVSLSWRVLDEKGVEVLKGRADSGETKELDFTALPAGIYTVFADASVARSKDVVVKDDEQMRILKMDPSGKTLDAPVSRFILPGPDEVETGGLMKVGFGSTSSPVWALVEWFGKDYELLGRKAIYLSGERGKTGSYASIECEYLASYPDAVEMQIFYFRNGEEYRYTRQFHRRRHFLDLPLTFESFEDRTAPSTEYTFSIRTAPDVEAVAAVFDKAIDAIHPNYWSGVWLRSFTVSAPPIRSRCGFVGEMRYYADAVLMSSSKAGGRMLGRARNASPDMMVVEEAAMMKDVEMEDGANEAADAGGGSEEQATVREKFENALTFQPFLRSDKDGKLSFTFSTSDKLSTYHVQVFAHDKAMRNGVLRQDMLVSIPLKVAVTEPRFLYDGDAWRMAVSVASNLDKPVTGNLDAYVYPEAARQGVEPSSVQRTRLTVPAGGSAPAFFDVKVPSGVSAIGVKVVFTGEGSSDAVFVSIPVYPAVQTLMEAHSAVLLPGMDRAKLLADLQGRFVNVKPSAADFKEITVLDMVRDAIPEKVDPDGKDVVSLSEAYYIRCIASKLGMQPALGEDSLSDAELMQKIMACRNGDGGFGWFEGMTSSRVITAVLLERFAKLRDRGFEVPDLTSSVQFLDDKQINREIPFWCGGLGFEQYLYVRSMYPSVPWKVDALGSKAVFSKELSDFKKAAKDYLVPDEKKDGRGLNGRILAKARRTRTLQNLCASDDGVSLAKSFGVKWGTASKLEKSLKADVLSLSEYAVDHKDGGMYFPNAVMPWRGLLESEAYAHSLLCDLLSENGHNDIADGIRIWLMLQKETQHWDTAPEYVDAISSVLDGSQEVLDTRVLLFQTTYTKPFKDVLAAGNGFTIARSFWRVSSRHDEDRDKELTTLEEIEPGTVLHRGEKVVAKYHIWNQENRSFVQVVVPREATLRPVEQLSGRIGWWMRPLSVAGWYSFSPQGYRNVKADRTEYYFDSYPEEGTTLTEEFFVQQDGVFSAPVVTIESLYAPHYRANGGFPGALKVED